jgi:hypothetical protein
MRASVYAWIAKILHLHTRRGRKRVRGRNCPALPGRDNQAALVGALAWYGNWVMVGNIGEAGLGTKEREAYAGRAPKGSFAHGLDNRGADRTADAGLMSDQGPAQDGAQRTPASDHIR